MTVKNYFSRRELKKLMFVTRYKGLKKHEGKRWIFILLFGALYFSIETLAGKWGVEFYIWDSALTFTIIVSSLILGNLFCGWGCFLFRYQDAAGLVGRFFLRGWYNRFFSSRIRKKLRCIKFAFLFLALVTPLIMQSYAVFIKIWGILFMAGLVFSLFESHAYCKYFCINGAMFKLVSLLNRKKLVRDKDLCINCSICSEVCLQDCEPAMKKSPINRDLWCTSCYRCKAVCPVNAIVIEKGTSGGRKNEKE